MQLTSRFSRHSACFRAIHPLSDDQIRRYAPSIFAEDKHASRSLRYTYIPTIHVIQRLRQEGFEPFMVCQTRVRDANRRDFTKHLVRLRHVNQITGAEANEIVLLNSHDGSSSYQMLAGMFRFVCSNGLVCGNTLDDIRIRHNGDIVGQVIEGAYTVLNHFETANAQRNSMKSLLLNAGEQQAFAHAALSLKYDDPAVPAPITETQLLLPRRFEDRKDDMWTTFSRVQENLVRGGLRGRSAAGKQITTRGITGIGQDIKINRALWILAEEMRKLK